MSSEPRYQSVREYIAAKKAGDITTTDRIVREVSDRFMTRKTDGTEFAELFEATWTVRLGEGL